MENVNFESIYSLLVEKFYFLRENYIKDELEDLIQEQLEDIKYELDEDKSIETAIIEAFTNRFFGRMVDQAYQRWINE